MARSISAASRMLTGDTSTPSDGAIGLDGAELADAGGYSGIPKHRHPHYARARSA